MAETTATTEATEVAPTVELRPISKEAREHLENEFYDYLGQEIYSCGRVYEAWGVGTMGLDDFSLAREDQDVLDSLVEIALKSLGFDPQSGRE